MAWPPTDPFKYRLMSVTPDGVGGFTMQVWAGWEDTDPPFYDRWSVNWVPSTTTVAAALDSLSAAMASDYADAHP